MERQCLHLFQDKRENICLLSLSLEFNRTFSFLLGRGIVANQNLKPGFGHKIVIQMLFLKEHSLSSPQPEVTWVLSYIVHGRIFYLMRFQQHVVQQLRKDIAKVEWYGQGSLLDSSLEEEMSKAFYANFPKNKRGCHPYYPLELTFGSTKMANSTHSSLWLSVMERYLRAQWDPETSNSCTPMYYLSINCLTGDISFQTHPYLLVLYPSGHQTYI